jgi:hypothetical protein
MTGERRDPHIKIAAMVGAFFGSMTRRGERPVDPVEDCPGNVSDSYDNSIAVTSAMVLESS